MPLGLSGNGLITGFDPSASGFGKVLQVVRATDTTTRTTTSSSFVDANISVTITPQKNTSAILLIWTFLGAQTNTDAYFSAQISDSSNNAVSGAQAADFWSVVNWVEYITIFGYSTPATTAATTYKGRFRRITAGTSSLVNADSTGQLYAIEVSA